MSEGKDKRGRDSWTCLGFSVDHLRFPVSKDPVKKHALELTEGDLIIAVHVVLLDNLLYLLVGHLSAQLSECGLNVVLRDELVVVVVELLEQSHNLVTSQVLLN